MHSFCTVAQLLIGLQVLLCMAVVAVLSVHLVASLHLLQDDLYNCSCFACNTLSGTWRDLQPVQDCMCYTCPVSAQGVSNGVFSWHG